ncbi:MAG TPA: hypothetical protein VJ372_21215 [Pyrinomonadaceae bacterium]|nr:hypothetical protein [Pyrinomonadaceae bacterium]
MIIAVQSHEVREDQLQAIFNDGADLPVYGRPGIEIIDRSFGLRRGRFARER